MKRTLITSRFFKILFLTIFILIFHLADSSAQTPIELQKASNSNVCPASVDLFLSSTAAIVGCSEIEVVVQVCSADEDDISGMYIEVDFEPNVSVVDLGDFNAGAGNTVNLTTTLPSFLEERCGMYAFTIEVTSNVDPVLLINADVSVPNCPLESDNKAIFPSQSTTTIGSPGATTLLSNIAVNSNQGQTVNGQLLIPSLSDNQGQNLLLRGTLIIDKNTTYHFPNSSDIAMDTDAEIIIESGSTLIFNDEAQIFGCDNMWESITVESGASLYMEDSFVADGKYAIKALDGATIGLRTTEFFNNYVGFNVPTSTSTQSITLSYFGYNAFRSNELKPPYAGEKAFAGVEINRVNGLIFQDFYFECMANGIVAYRSSFTVGSRSTFQDLRLDGAAVHPFTGYGIYADAQGNRTLTQTGNGSSGSPSFEVCEVGVLLKNGMNGTIEDNRMINVATGVKVENCVFKNVDILNNYIETTTTGIHLYQNTPTSLEVLDNTIVVNSIYPQVNGRGILINENPTGIGTYTYYEVMDNAILLENAYAGIDATDGEYLNISENTISLEENTEYTGINLSGTQYAQVNCNDIDGTITQFTQSTALYSIGSSDAIINCNVANDTEYGFNFNGMGDNSDFQGNIIKEHYIGLELEKNAVIGQQDHHGNIWTGNYQANGNGFGARHNATSSLTVSQSAFVVDEQENNDFEPSVSAISTWFTDINNPNASYYCSTSNTCDGGVGVGLHSLDNSGKNQKNNPDFTHLPKALQWTAKQHLFERILDHPERLTNTETTDEFLATEQQTNVGAFYGVVADLRAAKELAASDVDLLTLTNANVQQYLLELANIQEELNQPDLLPLTRTTLLASQKLLNTTLGENQRAADRIAINQHENQVTALAVVREQNQQIATDAIYATNQQQSYDLLIQVMANGVEALDSEQIDKLRSIANQCPLTGGDGVFLARSLYAGIEPNAVYDNELMCTELNLIEDDNKSVIGQSNLIITPNPATNQVEINSSTFLNNLDETYVITITDITGKILLTQQVYTSVEINTGTLHSGIYAVQLYDSNNALIANQKLVITK